MWSTATGEGVVCVVGIGKVAWSGGLVLAEIGSDSVPSLPELSTAETS